MEYQQLKGEMSRMEGLNNNLQGYALDNLADAALVDLVDKMNQVIILSDASLPIVNSLHADFRPEQFNNLPRVMHQFKSASAEALLFWLLVSRV